MIDSFDYAFLIDGIWRMASGQTAYADFFMPIGPIPHQISAWIFSLTGDMRLSIAIGLWIQVAAAGIAAFLVMKRLRWETAVAVAGAMICAGPLLIPHHSTWALIFTLMAAACYLSSWRPTVSAGLTGFFAMLTLITKADIGIATTVVFFICWLFDHRAAREKIAVAFIAGMVASLVIVTTLLWGGAAERGFRASGGGSWLGCVFIGGGDYGRLTNFAEISESSMEFWVIMALLLVFLRFMDRASKAGVALIAISFMTNASSSTHPQVLLLLIPVGAMLITLQLPPWRVWAKITIALVLLGIVAQAGSAWYVESVWPSTYPEWRGERVEWHGFQVREELAQDWTEVEDLIAAQLDSAPSLDDGESIVFLPGSQHLYWACGIQSFKRIPLWFHHGVTWYRESMLAAISQSRPEIVIIEQYGMPYKRSVNKQFDLFGHAPGLTDFLQGNYELIWEGRSYIALSLKDVTP